MMRRGWGDDLPGLVVHTMAIARNGLLVNRVVIPRPRPELLGDMIGETDP